MKFLIDMNLSPLWVSFLSEKGLLLAIPHHQNAKAGRQIYGSVRIECAGGAEGSSVPKPVPHTVTIDPGAAGFEGPLAVPS